MHITAQTTALTEEQQNYTWFIQELQIFKGGQPNYYDGYKDELSALRKLISEVGEKIVLDGERKKKAAIKSNTDDVSWDNYYCEFGHMNNYRDLTYKMFFVRAKSIFESRFIQLCLIAHKHNPLPSKNIPDTMTKHFEDFEKYMEKYVSKSNFKNVPFYENFKHFREVRNLIEHRNDISKENKTINWLVENFNSQITISRVGVKNEKFKVTIVSSKFILEFIQDIEAELNRLSDLVYKKIHNDLFPLCVSMAS